MSASGWALGGFAAYAMVVNAKDDRAAMFYHHHGFIIFTIGISTDVVWSLPKGSFR